MTAGAGAPKANVVLPVVRPVSEGPHYRRPAMSGEAASRRLRWVVRAWFNRVERNLEVRDWIVTEATRIEPDVRHASEVRILAKLIRSGMDPDDVEVEGIAEIRAARVAPRLARQVARKSAEALFGRRAASGAMPRIQVKGAAGLGKTQAIIEEYQRRPSLWKRNIVVYTKTRALGDDFAISIGDVAPAPDGSRPRVIVIRGREVEGMCRPERLEVVAAARTAGCDSIYRAVCRAPAAGKLPDSRCPFYDWCKERAYLSQFDSEPALRVMPHARLILKQPEDLRLPAPDLVIIDESAIETMITRAVVDPAVLTDHGTYASKQGEEHLIQEAMDVGKAVVQALAAGGNGAVARLRAVETIKPEHLRSATAAANLGAQTAMPSLRPGMDPKEAKSRCEGRKKHSGADVALIIGQLARDLENNRDTSIGVEWDIEHSATVDDGAKVLHPMICSHGLKASYGVPSNIALLLLDADADLEINRRLFGPKIRNFTIPAVRHADVMQIHNATLATSSLAPDVTLKNNHAKAHHLRGRIATLVQREVGNENRKVLVIAAKAVRLVLTGEDRANLPKSTQWLGADITHFGRHLGANDWADFDTVIVLGRLEMNAVDAERMARAIWANAPDVKLNLPGEYLFQLRHHDLRHGEWSPVKVRVHPDQRVQSLVEITRENAMGQGIDRLRLIHRKPDRPARVLVVCNLPVPGLVVDQLLTLNDMLEGGTIWERAMVLVPSGVLPLMPDWLVGNLPGVFSSERTAKREIGNLKVPLRNKNTYCQMALLRRPGQSRHSKALVRSDVTDPKGALERLLGVELVEFRLVLEADVASVPTLDPPAWAQPADPATVYRRGVLEPPPTDVLNVRDVDGRPVALLEGPRMGSFVSAGPIASKGLDAELVDPPSLPPQSGGGLRSAEIAPSGLSKHSPSSLSVC